MRMIRVVHVPVGEEPRVIEVENSLESLQSLVGGSIEYHDMGGGIVRYCNEDGVGLELPQNGCGILGPYVFSGNDADGKEVGLTDAQCTSVLAHVAMFRAVRHSGTEDFECKSFDSFEEMMDDLEAKRRAARERN